MRVLAKSRKKSRTLQDNKMARQYQFLFVLWTWYGFLLWKMLVVWFYAFCYVVFFYYDYLRWCVGPWHLDGFQCRLLECSELYQAVVLLKVWVGNCSMDWIVSHEPDMLICLKVQTKHVNMTVWNIVNFWENLFPSCCCLLLLVADLRIIQYCNWRINT